MAGAEYCSFTVTHVHEAVAEADSDDEAADQEEVSSIDVLINSRNTILASRLLEQT